LQSEEERLDWQYAFQEPQEEEELESWHHLSHGLQSSEEELESWHHLSHGLQSSEDESLEERAIMMSSEPES